MRQALAAHGRSPAEIQELLDADNQAPVVNLIALPGIGDLQEAFEKGAVEGELVEDSALYSAGVFGSGWKVFAEGTVRAQDVGSQLVTRALVAAPLEGQDSAWLDCAPVRAVRLHCWRLWARSVVLGWWRMSRQRIVQTGFTIFTAAFSRRICCSHRGRA